MTGFVTAEEFDGVIDTVPWGTENRNGVDSNLPSCAPAEPAFANTTTNPKNAKKFRFKFIRYIDFIRISRGVAGNTQAGISSFARNVPPPAACRRGVNDLPSRRE
ncbi:MAG: hypothetical protein ACRC2T_07640 [Thermoguttaceae bacterium]